MGARVVGGGAERGGGRGGGGGRNQPAMQIPVVCQFREVAKEMKLKPGVKDCAGQNYCEMLLHLR